MSISATCPCGQKVQVQNDSTSDSLECPKCHKQVRIRKPEAQSTVAPALIKFDCPQCGRHLRAKSSAEGRSGRCPGCSNQFQVPHCRPATQPAGSGIGNRKRVVLAGTAAAGFVVLVLGILVATSIFGGDREAQLRERSEELIRVMSEDPSSLADFLRFEDSSEKEKFRIALRAKGKSPALQEKLDLKKIEISGNHGTSTFALVAGKEPELNLFGKMEFVLKWEYEGGEWYVETVKFGPLPAMDAREMWLASK